MKLTTPSGANVICRANKTYAVVIECTYTDQRPPVAHVTLRTDNLDTARTHLQRRGGGQITPNMRHDWHLYDLRTGARITPATLLTES